MDRRRFLGACASIGLPAVASTARADHRFHRTQPRCLKELPPFDYRSGSVVGPVFDVSLVGLPLPTQPAGIGSRYFQWSGSSLTLGHCSLSKLAVTISEAGRWTISFQAEQNSSVVDADKQLLIPLVRDGKGGRLPYTGHLKRNTFHVAFRGLGAAQAPVATPELAPGKPVLAMVALAPFTVERGVPKRWSQASPNADPEILRQYHRIDRFEVEFSYE